MKICLDFTLAFAIIIVNASLAYAQESNWLTYVYSPEFKIERNEVLSKEKCQQSFLVKAFYDNSVVSAKIFQYVESKNNSSKTKISFRVTIITYSDSTSAIGKFTQLQSLDEADLESVLQKDWDFVAVCKNQIFRIDAICLMPQKKWIEIKSKLQTKINRPIKRIECYCGQGCAIE